MDDLDGLASDVRDAESVVALTGAGISAPSGVPTFRGDDGVWKRFDQGQFRYERFQRDPGAFWEDRLVLHDAMYGDETIEPNEAHLALAQLVADGSLSAIVTQNVDGLHHRAARQVTGDDDEASRSDSVVSPPEDGASEATASVEEPSIGDIVELHGNSRRVVCTGCGRRADSDGVIERARDGACPPRCDCGGVLKPDVVLFGEQLPGPALQRARSLAAGCDVFLAIGSSLVVEPAASLPRFAVSSGATLGVVNLESTPRDSEATYVFESDVTDVLPALRDLVLEE